MVRLKGAVTGLVVALIMTMFAAPAASADTLTTQGLTTGTAYRGGIPASGGISYAVGVQLNRDAAGRVTQARGVARITKLTLAQRVQVTSVALGRNGVAVTRNTTPANSGTAGSVISYSNWVPINPGTCANFQTRGIFGIRWNDGALSTVNILSSPTRVCRPANAAPSPPPAPPTPPGIPPRPADRDCGDFATQAQAQAFFELYFPYYGDFSRLDADNDHVACETLP